MAGEEEVTYSGPSAMEELRRAERELRDNLASGVSRATNYAMTRLRDAQDVPATPLQRVFETAAEAVGVQPKPKPQLQRARTFHSCFHNLGVEDSGVFKTIDALYRNAAEHQEEMLGILTQPTMTRRDARRMGKRLHEFVLGQMEGLTLLDGVYWAFADDNFHPWYLAATHDYKLRIGHEYPTEVHRTLKVWKGKETEVRWGSHDPSLV